MTSEVLDTQSPEVNWRGWFEEQFSRHTALVRTVIWNRLGRIHGGSLIEELAAETWVRALRGVQKSSFDPHRDFAPWICAIAVNVCREQIRRLNGKGTTALVEPDELPDPVDFKQSQELLELHRAIESCIGRLDSEDQNVYRLRFEQGLSGRATAESLGIPESTFREKVLPKLLRRIAQCLATKGFEEISDNFLRKSGPPASVLNERKTKAK